MCEMSLTSNDKLLAINPGVALWLLQKADPVVHLLWRVCITVDHPIGCDNHKGVGPATEGINLCHTTHPQGKHLAAK